METQHKTKILGMDTSNQGINVLKIIPPYIRQYTSPDENVEYGSPHSIALL